MPMLFDGLLANCKWVDIHFLWRPNLPDEGDNQVIELAIASGATTVITHNLRDFMGELKFPEVRICTPATFLTLMAAQADRRLKNELQKLVHRAVLVIDSKVTLNKGLWGLAERLANGQSLTEAETELALRAERVRVAEVALQKIADSIRYNPDNPDTQSGQHLRRFIWSLFNGHHALNLWRIKDVLAPRHNAAVTEVFSSWMRGFASEDASRRTLMDSGETD